MVENSVSPGSRVEETSPCWAKIQDATSRLWWTHTLLVLICSLFSFYGPSLNGTQKRVHQQHAPGSPLAERGGLLLSHTLCRWHVIALWCLFCRAVFLFKESPTQENNTSQSSSLMNVNHPPQPHAPRQLLFTLLQVQSPELVTTWFSLILCFVFFPVFLHWRCLGSHLTPPWRAVTRRQPKSNQSFWLPHHRQVILAKQVMHTYHGAASQSCALS